jgi:hypothetical protein
MIEFLQDLSMLVTGIMIVATIFVRITPNPDDDTALSAFVIKIQGYMKYLPTLGVNPKTQKLEEALKQLQDEKKAE